MRRFFLFILAIALIYFTGEYMVHAYQNCLYKPLSGVVIVIDAGHGGKDMGAMVSDVKEAQLNLDIAKKLEKKLIQAGSQVIMTRTDEHDLASENALRRKNEDMRNRVKIINDEKVDLFISIHLNTYPSNDVSGAQIFYKGSSERLALILQEQLNPKRIIKTGDYYILRESRPIGVLIECGFITNDDEREQLKNEAFQDELTDKIQIGLLRYLNEIGFE